MYLGHERVGDEWELGEREKANSNISPSSLRTLWRHQTLSAIATSGIISLSRQYPQCIFCALCFHFHTSVSCNCKAHSDWLTLCLSVCLSVRAGRQLKQYSCCLVCSSYSESGRESTQHTGWLYDWSLSLSLTHCKCDKTDTRWEEAPVCVQPPTLGTDQIL